MTFRAPGATERGTDAPSRSNGTREAVGAVLVVLALGLALRLIIAYLLPGSGFANDLSSFRAWAGNLAADGPFGFYQRPFFHDYTPGYLYVLWLVGIVGQFAGGIGDLIKIPAILSDLAVGWLVWSMARELGARQPLALAGALVAVLNPISWFDSVAWGQVDSFGVVFMLLALRELWRDRPERAAIFTVIAAVIKPQLGILIPLVAVVTIRRALWPPNREDGEDEPETGPEPPMSWERRTGRPVRILTTAIAGIATAFVLCLPFGLSVVEFGGSAPYVHSGLLEQVAKTAGGYPYLTVNAYNPWALVPGDTGKTLAADGLWVCDAPIPVAPNGDDQCSQGTATFLGVPALAIATGLLLATIALVLWIVARHPDRRTLLVGVAILAMAFFVAPTRVHERYMYPFFAVAPILAVVSWRWRIAYLFLSVATFANMYVVLTTIYPNNPSVSDWLGIGPSIRQPAGVALVAITHLVAFGWALLQLRNGARATLADEIEDSALEPEPPAEATYGEVPRPRLPAAASFAAEAPALAPGVAAMPVWRSRPTLTETGVVGWIRSRLWDRPVRPDRSGLLAHETGGRIDRLDVWIVVVLVVGTLVLRMFRLSEPYQMHFDEVYHARTATEFLQDWRYGISHDIYEWTHPHLAKYAMAAGLVAFGDDRVTGTSELGVPARAAAIETRYLDTEDRSGGDRLFVASPGEVRVYDLGSRELIGRVPFSSDPVALAVDQDGHRLFVATADGRIASINLPSSGAVSIDGSVPTAEVTPVASLDQAPDRLILADDGKTLLTTAGNHVVSVDSETGEVTGRAEVPGLADVASAGSGPRIVATPTDVTDAGAVAKVLAGIIGGSATTYEDRISAGEGPVVLGAIKTAQQRTDLEKAITDHRLEGIAIEDGERMAIAGSSGVALIDPVSGTTLATIPLQGGAHGLALVTAESPKLYVTTGPSSYTTITVGGNDAKDGPVVGTNAPLPGPGSKVIYDDPSQQVHILGRTADGAPTIYVIEPHANAVYADARLPFEPVTWVGDIASQFPSSDRQQILALSANGEVAAVDIGKHAFAWRVPGVIAGSLTAGLLYLLTRILFRRRIVALLVALFVAVDGMFFVQARIGMNDVYVGLFIIAAYTLFAALWTGRWRGRWAFWLTMPAIGFLLGLALASKWVAAYAIGALALLILVRSALGRVLSILGLIALTAVLGYMAISVPGGAGIGNVTFLVIMVALTLVAVFVTITHPIAWSDDEMRLAIAGPAVLGGIVFLGALGLGRLGSSYALGPVQATPLHLAFALAVLSPVVYAIFRVAAGWGFGPFAAPPPPDDPARRLEPPAPPAEGWLRPGWLLGLPIVWTALSLLALPIAVYVISYIPWAFIEGHQIVPGWPPGHTGQTLLDLTGQMYRYHNGLTAAHAASSPWWAWPFDLKPVWFYQEGFAGNTAASLYDAGNLVVWWFGVPALAFAAVMAYRRRSLPLALVMIGFAAQWISWARIDRAAFQYHYYTALPFVVIALAYFVAELWHGASQRTWILARVAAAAAIVAPVAMWLLSRPLCGFVGVLSVNPGSQACPALIPEFVLTVRAAGIAAVVLFGVLLVVRALLELDRREDIGRGLVELFLTMATTLAALAIVSLLPEVPILTLQSIPVEPVALVALVPVGYLAVQVINARDARRFVAGLLVAIVATFVVFYPNISALPLPSILVNSYQGVLPTYVYPFQFPVSTIDRNSPTPLFTPSFFVLAGALVVTCLVVAYSTWTWRLAAAADTADDEAAEALSGA